MCKEARKGDDNGEPIEAAYEGLSYLELEKVVSLIGHLELWRTACKDNNVSAERMLTVSGSESEMGVTRHHAGPFI